MVQGMFDIGAEKERERMRERARRGDGETGRHDVQGLPMAG